MRAQNDSLRNTTGATQGAAAVMALIAVMALGLMGFAMGYAKADRAPLLAHAGHSSIPGVAAARVSLVTAGEDEIVLAAVKPAVPAPQLRVAPPVAPAAIVTEPAVEASAAIAEPQAEPLTVSEPAQAPIA